MEHVIEIKNLVKDYGQGRGVFDVSFFVNKGEVFGFLGPNGAGKSTTIRHLMGFSVPDSGITLLKGENSLKERDVLMQGVSYIPGEISLPLNLRGYEVIKEQMQLKQVKDKSLYEWLASYFELDTKVYCKEMSLGSKRKMAIVCAFMSDPDIIIMDEPSSGLDPEMQEKFIELVKMEKNRGKTILLSSHIFQEVDACCDRIAVIKDGKIVSLFNADDLKHKSVKTYHVTYPSERRAAEVKILLLNNNFKCVSSTIDDRRLTVSVDESKTDAFFILLPKDLIDFTEKKETLEDYFMSFYKEDKTYGGV